MTEAEGTALLRIERLNVAYGDLQVLWDVDLSVYNGEIVTVVGNNGAGKSTLLRTISRLVRPLSGTMLFGNEQLGRMQSHDVVERGLIQVPEARRIFPEMTVLENLKIGAYARSARMDRESNVQRAFSLFARLQERSSQLGGTLSGGEQQMLAIARGLMANPRLLLLDEPSLGLSPLLVKAMFEAIAEINRNGVTILLVEQNVAQSLRIAHRGYVLETGRIVMTGAASELLGNDHVRKAFLGM